MWTMDTTTDTGEQQADLRAAPYLSPNYLTELREATPRPAPDADWRTWSAHRAFTVVTLEAAHDDQPPDTPGAAHRQWGLTVTPIGRDGWEGEPNLVTVFVTLTRPGPGRGWRVSAVNVS